MSDHGKVDAIGVNNTSEGSAFVELHFEDGSIVSHELAQPYLHIDFPKIPEETAKLIRDYSKGKVTMNQVREALGVDGSPQERAFFEKFDGRLEEYLQRAFGPMLEVFQEMTESKTGGNESFDAPEVAFPEEDVATNVFNFTSNVETPRDDVFITIPKDTPLEKVFAIVQTLENTGYPYTINKE